MSLFEVACKLQTLEREVARLRVEVRQLHGRASDAQAELVRAAFEAMGDHAFNSAELLGRALRNDAAGLRLAALLAGRSVRRTGRLLAAVAGKATPGGLILQRIGSDRAGGIWCVSREG